MSTAGLLKGAKDTTYVELGAGKAYLTLMIARATDATHFVINDNASFRLKGDRVLRRMIRENVKNLHFVRCQADLKDFLMAGSLEELQTSAQRNAEEKQTPRRVVGVGKHLCGAATDFALRGLTHYGHQCNRLQAGACVLG
jgi:tRNA:m4X modification enzyme